MKSGCALNEGRGEDPVKTATPLLARPAGRQPLNEGRGEDPVKTRPGILRCAAKYRTLNEGRGEDPVKTIWAKGPSTRRPCRRSTKDGEKTPSKLARTITHDVIEARSTKDGEKTPSKPVGCPVPTAAVQGAQRRTGRRPRQNRRRF